MERIAGDLRELAESLDCAGVEAKGHGMAHGLAFTRPQLADRALGAAFERGLIVETAGPKDQVVKLLPPLTIADDELEQGQSILADGAYAVC